ncbi:type IV pilus modification PilV family protein [Proteocatella sphenisci]|uniref:type IV pilus modification PilV family protein n=1 Tax=Proteocatella sphenisci TaxID=181070 RepID=UPI00048FF457|nr:prepilin-type N-terminal cleavage/methylation domain-containing protein [Proteocatella sphenisci]
MRIKKLAQDNKGISLVEIMVGMLIFSIISITVIVIMFPTLNSINKTKDLSEMGMFADNISAEIINDIKMANSIEVTKVSGSGDTLTLVNQEHSIVYETVDEKIKRNYDGQKDEGGTKIFNDLVSSKYYENKGVEVSYEAIIKTVKSETVTVGCKVKLKILNKEKETAITREYSVLSLVI